MISLCLTSLLILFLIGRAPLRNLITLIGIFGFATLLLVYHDVEFLGWMLLIIYVGAIGVLFLFLIMTTDFRNIENTPSVSSYDYILYITICALILAHFPEFIIDTSFLSQDSSIIYHGDNILGLQKWYHFEKNNLLFIGLLMFNKYYVFVHLAAWILLIALIAAVGLSTDRWNDLKKLFFPFSLKFTGILGIRTWQDVVNYVNDVAPSHGAQSNLRLQGPALHPKNATEFWVQVWETQAKEASKYGYKTPYAPDWKYEYTNIYIKPQDTRAMSYLDNLTISRDVLGAFDILDLQITPYYILQHGKQLKIKCFTFIDNVPKGVTITPWELKAWRHETSHFYYEGISQATDISYTLLKPRVVKVELTPTEELLLRLRLIARKTEKIIYEIVPTHTKNVLPNDLAEQLSSAALKDLTRPWRGAGFYRLQEIMLMFNEEISYANPGTLTRAAKRHHPKVVEGIAESWGPIADHVVEFLKGGWGQQFQKFPIGNVPDINGIFVSDKKFLVNLCKIDTKPWKYDMQWITEYMKGSHKPLSNVDRWQLVATDAPDFYAWKLVHTTCSAGYFTLISGWMFAVCFLICIFGYFYSWLFGKYVRTGWGFTVHKWDEFVNEDWYIEKVKEDPLYGFVPLEWVDLNSPEAVYLKSNLVPEKWKTTAHFEFFVLIPLFIFAIIAAIACCFDPLWTLTLTFTWLIFRFSTKEFEIITTEWREILNNLRTDVHNDIYAVYNFTKKLFAPIWDSVIRYLFCSIRDAYCVVYSCISNILDRFSRAAHDFQDWWFSSLKLPAVDSSVWSEKIKMESNDFSVDHRLVYLQNVCEEHGPRWYVILLIAFCVLVGLVIAVITNFKIIIIPFVIVQLFLFFQISAHLNYIYKEFLESHFLPIIQLYREQRDKLMNWLFPPFIRTAVFAMLDLKRFLFVIFHVGLPVILVEAFIKFCTFIGPRLPYFRYHWPRWKRQLDVLYQAVVYYYLQRIQGKKWTEKQRERFIKQFIYEWQKWEVLKVKWGPLLTEFYKRADEKYASVRRKKFIEKFDHLYYTAKEPRWYKPRYAEIKIKQVVLQKFNMDELLWPAYAKEHAKVLKSYEKELEIIRVERYFWTIAFWKRRIKLWRTSSYAFIGMVWSFLLPLILKRIMSLLKILWTFIAWISVITGRLIVKINIIILNLPNTIRDFLHWINHISTKDIQDTIIFCFLLWKTQNKLLLQKWVIFFKRHFIWFFKLLRILDQTFQAVWDTIWKAKDAPNLKMFIIQQIIILLRNIYFYSRLIFLRIVIFFRIMLRKFIIMLIIKIPRIILRSIKRCILIFMKIIKRCIKIILGILRFIERIVKWVEKFCTRIWKISRWIAIFIWRKIVVWFHFTKSYPWFGIPLVLIPYFLFQPFVHPFMLQFYAWRLLELEEVLDFLDYVSKL